MLISLLLEQTVSRPFNISFSLRFIQKVIGFSLIYHQFCWFYILTTLISLRRETFCLIYTLCYFQLNVLFRKHISAYPILSQQEAEKTRREENSTKQDYRAVGNFCQQNVCLLKQLIYQKAYQRVCTNEKKL